MKPRLETEWRTVSFKVYVYELLTDYMMSTATYSGITKDKKVSYNRARGGISMSAHEWPNGGKVFHAMFGNMLKNKNGSVYFMDGRASINGKMVNLDIENSKELKLMSGSCRAALLIIENMEKAL